LTSLIARHRVRGVSSELKESPLQAAHEELGGKLVPFAGWNMPIRYGSILEEHGAVRTGAGVFDISHMGQFVVTGAGAEAWLDGLLTNHVGALGDGEGHYTFLLNEGGGVIDDLILYRQDAERFFLVVNAAKIAEDFAWMEARLVEGVALQDLSEEFAAMAVQGPDSAAVFAKMVPGQELPPRNGIATLQFGEQELIVCRTGYTGEDGFEFFCPAAAGADWLRTVVKAGARACGLGARDTLRLEMCYPLNGSDLSPERTPLQAGLGFFVKLDKGAFVGSEVLVRQKEEGLGERLVAIQCEAKGPPIRGGAEVLSEDGEKLGVLTSGTLSPSLGLGIGLAYLPVETAKIGKVVNIVVRGRHVPARIVKKPFYKKA
jgi:aminomethyltransferase